MDENGKIDKQNPVFMTIDVEEYYHILGVKGTLPIHEWDSLESRVELGMQKCFDLLERMNTRATLFFLGYIAAKHPRLVRRAVDLGHEIASHGMYHQEIDHLSKSAFYRDASDSRKLLEDISGREVRGWRSPGFSSNMSTPWFFDVLVETGYKYDSSIMPMKKSIQGVNHLMRDPRFIHVQSGKIFEYPISVVEFGFLRVCMFGGGYLRLFPQFLISLMKDRVLDKQIGRAHV